MTSRFHQLLFGLLVIGSFSAAAQPGCPQLPITLSGHVTYCVGMPGATLGVNENYQSYLWLPGQESTQSVTLTLGNYQVITTHYTGCMDTLDIVVNQVANPPQPVISATGPTEFCDGETMLIQGPPGYPYYTWNTGSVTPNLAVYESGTYVLSIEDSIGCESSSNSISVTVNPLPISYFSPEVIGLELQMANLSQNATSYEWDFGDGTIDTSFEPNHTYSTTGPHTIQLVAFNDCTSDTSWHVMQNVGIEDINDIIGVSVYPNPSSDYCTIEFDCFKSEQVMLSVSNQLGQVEFSKSVLSSEGQNRIALDLQELPAGMYILKLSSSKASIASRVSIVR